MLKQRNLLFLSLLILGVLLIAGCSPKPPVLVTFDSQGGSAVNSQIVDHGEKITKPTEPTKEGYTFDGWYKESECTNAWDFYSDTVTSDVTLYAKWASYKLRETGPAGGLIFYVKEGGYSDGWMYLEAAPYNQSPTAEWGCYGVSVLGADGTAVDTGEQNTIDIETGCATAGTAADICANLSLGGYSDWFLPSKDELNLMYENLKVHEVGGFDNHYYWSSSEFNTSYAWNQYFYSGYQDYKYKFQLLRVRAIRAF